MIKQEDLWGGLGCLEGTFLGRVKNIAGEPRGSEGLVQRSSCSSWYPAQSTQLYLTNMPGTRLIWGMWHALARGDTWDTAVPWGGMHTLPQPRPLMTINEISKCYRIQRGCSCCAHPTFCSLLSQNLRTHLAAVVFPQEAVVLLVPYRPSPNTDYSYLAHPDLKEELSNQDICAFVHNRFGGNPFQAHFNSSSCSGGLSLWNSPKHAFLSNEENPRYCL